MKKTTPLICIALLMTAWMFAGTADAASDKIGIVNFQKVLKESKGGKAAKAEIETRGKSLEAKLKTEGEAIENLKKKLEAEALVMNEEMRENKEREFRIKVNDFKTMKQRFAKELREFEAEVIKRVQKDVFEVVEEIGKKGNYKLILEKTAVVYYPDTIDITSELIKLYDAKK